MNVIRTEIPDVLLIEPKVFGDARGFFFESWNERSFSEAVGQAVRFVQDNHSRSAKGVLRGLHYQIEQAQGKLVRVAAGEVFDVVVDLRRSSPTFGKSVGLMLSEENKRMLWVPPGFAHGFLVTSQSADFLYKTTDYYAPKHERSLLWNDPALAIDWPLEGAPQLKANDLAGTPLSQAETYPVKRVLVTGAAGQVGAAVVAQLRESWNVIAHDRASLDLADPARIAAAIAAARPDVIVNAGAYTAVDRAETDTQAALAANSLAPGAIGIAAKHVGATVIHFSTDYVFDGAKGSPYAEGDPTNPTSVYGASKLTGERALAASGAAHVILRTSWVYAPRGKNFLLTMLNAAKTREEVRVVDDQHGAPTSAFQLARATQALLVRPVEALRAASGVYHCTAAGEVTWCGFARAIYERWPKLEPDFRAPRVTAITSAEYPTPVKRPANSRLSNAKLRETFGIVLEPWEQALDETLAALASA